MRFPQIRSTFGVTPYNPDRDPERARAIYEHYQDQMGAQPLPDESLPWNVPFEPGVAAQREFDDMLQRRIVDPLAQAGYEDLGAGLAAVPSAAHSMIVPQTEFDVAGAIIPLPKVAKAIKADKRAFPEITKAMRAEKKAKDVREYSKAVEALRGDDPDLRAIKVSPDINVTPGMAQKNFEASQKKNAENLRMDTLFGDLNENPRSTTVSGVRGGLYGPSTNIDLVQQVLRLNDDIPGLKKLGMDREIILKGRNPSEIRWEDREKLGLLKIEKEIAKIMKANQKQLKLPIGMDEQRTDLIPRWELEDRIRKKEYDKAEAKATEDASSDWTKIDPKKLYELDGMILSGKELKDELLQMSTGDFHMAKWKEFEQPKKSFLESYDMEDEDFGDLRDFTSKPGSKKVDGPKGPKGDPEASLSPPPDRFAGIKSQLDVIPSRVDERGQAFGDVGSYDFRPYDEIPMQFEPIQKRNYVERELDPKEKMWNEIVASDPHLPDSPEYLQNLRKYFDNRWEQAQGTAEGKMMQLDMPMSQRLKPKDEKSVTSGYIDELAFKRFAEPYDKTIQAERALAIKPGDKPVRTAKIDDKIQSYFGDEIKSPGRKLQDQMYPPKPKEPERFGQIKEQITEKTIKSKPIKGSYKKASYRIVDPSGNDIKELGYFRDYESGRESLEKWLRSKGLSGDELDDALYEYQVMHENGMPF